MISSNKFVMRKTIARVGSTNLTQRYKQIRRFRQVKALPSYMLFAPTVEYVLV
jgi:hypothetical protein